MPSPQKRGCAVKDLVLQFWVDLLKLTDGWCRSTEPRQPSIFLEVRGGRWPVPCLLSSNARTDVRTVFFNTVFHVA